MWHDFLKNSFPSAWLGDQGVCVSCARWLLPLLACVSWDLTQRALRIYADWLGCMWAIFAGQEPAVAVCAAHSLTCRCESDITQKVNSPNAIRRVSYERYCALSEWLHSSPARPPRADWRDAIANPIKTHDSVFTACRSFLAWGLIVFAALLPLITDSTRETSVGFPSRNLIKAAVSLSDFGPRQLINLFVFFFAAVH